MKKMTYAVLAVIVLFLITPMSVDARGRGIHGGVNMRIGPHYRYPARAWRAYPRWGFGFYWGGPVGVRPWYPGPYYYYGAPPVVIEQPPPVYTPPQAPPPQYWYYCQDPQGYYPYVKNCPGGWMKVVPQVTPPNQ